MKKTELITTAANSKTMNAVEKISLFAEAEATEVTPDFTHKDELPETGQKSKSPSTSKGKKKQR